MHDNTQQPIPGDSNFLVTDINLPGESGPQLTLGDVASAIECIKNHYSERRELEEDWVSCWAHYFGNVRSQSHLRATAAKFVGDVNDDWRHKISTGKAYENVETICGYLQSAFFPNKQWFNLTPVSPGYMELVKPVTHFMQQSLDVAHFESYWDMAIRQAVILGTSVIALPWRVETQKCKKRIRVRKPLFTEYGVEIGEEEHFEVVEEDKVTYNDPDFEVLDMFDTYLDPCATNPSNANILRRMYKTRAEVLELIEDGFYNYGDKTVAVTCKAHGTEDTSTTNKESIRMFGGLEYKPEEKLEVLEFWGDLELQGKNYKNIVATICGGQVLRFEANPYWYGKPFIVITYVPVNRQVYGLGALQPTLGLLHEMNILTNQRLDNLEMAVDSMWTLVPDGTLRTEDIVSKPGKVFEVSDHNALQPVPRGDIGNLTITYQEGQFLETRIDKAVGTGAFIGVGAGRSGERVTATEINAQRDAGGNRLSARHQHLENTALLPLLTKIYKGFQQFISRDSVVRMPSPVPGSFTFASVGPSELVYDFKCRAEGATYIADKEFELQKLLDFMNVVGNSQTLQPLVNWPVILEKLITKFGFEDAESLILPPPPPPEPAPEAPQDPNIEALMGMGGQTMVDHVKNLSASPAAPQAMAEAYNQVAMGGRGNPNDPMVQAGIQQQLQAQGPVI